MQPCFQAFTHSSSDSRRLGAKHHSVKSDVTFDLSLRTTGNEAKAWCIKFTTPRKKSSGMIAKTLCDSVFCCLLAITGLSTTFHCSWQKFLSSRIVITECRSLSLLGGSGGMPPPPGNFYIWSPQKWNFLDSEHKFPITSVPKVIVPFQFYLYKLMPSVVFYL